MRRRSNLEVAGLALLAYLPFLLSDPGKLSADSKQALYLDPGGLLSSALHLWNPAVGAGTVPHQELGYLVPAGPWFWLLDALSVPDWVAQRLWLGTLTLAALLGARWLLGRLGIGPTGALVGALVYGCSPYQLAFTARISVLLLPWAALPWLVGLAGAAMRSGRRREVAAFGLALFLVGGVNASSLLLALLGPVLLTLDELRRRAVPVARGCRTLLALGAVSVGVSAWWLVGVRLQGAHGLPVLQLTENLATVAARSTPGDVLRGLGNWFFYGQDRQGYSLDQAEAYDRSSWVVAITYVVPALGLVAAVLVRWAYRSYFLALVVGGTVLAVGAWPIEDPSAFARGWRTFADETSLGLAFRNSPRAVPLVVLGLAGLVGAGIEALGRSAAHRRWAPLAAAGTATVALAGLLPVVGAGGFLTDSHLRPEAIPAHWRDAAAAIDDGDPATRVLELPGSAFAAYSWGATVDPLLPLLIDRPYVGREVLPEGMRSTVNLVAALDRRVQLGTLDPASVAPVARLLGAGTVVVRGDLARSGRFDAVDPTRVWEVLTDPPAPGLGEPETFGVAEGGIPAAAVFDVLEPEPIIRTAPVTGSVLLGGDGDGIVDAAGAGVLDGHALVLPATPLTDTAFDIALEAGAHLLLTDSHRRRAETWFYSIRDNRGATERAGVTDPDPTGYDFRLDPYPGSGDDSRTVAVQQGGTVEATAAGGPEHPEDRAVFAADADPDTAWRVRSDPVGARLSVTFDEPVPLDGLVLRQASGPGEPSIRRLAVTADGRRLDPVELGPASLDGGQPVELAAGSVQHLELEILEVAPGTDGSSDGVGLRDLGLGDHAIEESIRLPVDLLERVGDDLPGHSLDIVLTRLQWGPASDRPDEEPRLDRTFSLPVGRSFGLEGVLAEGAVAPAASPVAPCRSDLVTVDDVAVPVRVRPTDEGAPRFEGCEPIPLAPGEHRVVAGGAAAVDQLVLSTSPAGDPIPVAPRGDPRRSAGTDVEVRRDRAASVRLDATGDGAPYWLELGQGFSRGWSLRGDSTVPGVAAPTLVDGYANAWLVEPDGPGPTAVFLRWRPDQAVRWAMALSAVVVVALVVVVVRRRREPWPALAAVPNLALGDDGVATPGPGTTRRTAIGAVTGAVAVALVSTPVAGLVAATTAAAVARWPRARLAVVAAVPLALLVARATARPTAAWLALAVVVGAVIGEWARSVRSRRPVPPSP